MKKTLNKTLNNIKKEVISHKIIYILLGIILAAAFFVRVYRLSALLAFYYDQGRDALVIWKLWHEGKPFLIGPVTGLEGLFLGPFFYYLIAPFYLLGGGDPVVPGIFLAALVTLAIFIVYYLGWKVLNRTTGLIAALICGLSYYLVLPGRWLSNPTPIFLSGIIYFLSLWKITQTKKDYWWIIAALMIGLSLQFESASGFFYLPILALFTFWQRQNLPKLKTIIFSVAVLFITFIPQLAFNFKHENILLNNFLKLFFQEKGFKLDITQVLEVRMNYFWTVFYSKIFPDSKTLSAVIGIISLALLIIKRKILSSSKVLTLLIIFLGVPILGYLLFQGNHGNIYDYYMTGYYFPLILLFSLGLGLVWNYKLGKIIVLIFIFLFLKMNVPMIRNYIISGVDGPTTVSLGNEVQAVDWVYNDAQKRGNFNVDVYVPPVIPHTYNYLFLWQGTKRCGSSLCGMLINDSSNLLYTLYEVDPPHPERLEAWLERQKTIGEVEEETRFGGIIVQRRHRI
jgi:4-amino-4-deoxy-L-arabinose transferase-like glycosyltransferase